MSDPLGIGASVGTGTSQVTQAAPAGPIAEFATPLPPAALGAAMLHATVVGNSADGTTLLRTPLGTVAIQTNMTLPPGTSLDLKLLAGTPATAMLLNIHEDGAGASGAGAATPTLASGAQAAATNASSMPALLDLGTTLEATVSGPPSGRPIPPGTIATPAATTTDGEAVQPATSGSPMANATSSASAAPAASNLPPAPSAQSMANQGEPSVAQPAVVAPPSAPPTPAAAIAASSSSPASTAPPPSGTAPPTPLAVGSNLVLRIVAPPTEPTDDVLLGQVVSGAGHDTVVDTPLGLITLGRRLGLQPGDTLAFEPLETSPPPASAGVPERATRTGGWPALDMTLEALEAGSPELAAQLRAILAPASGAELGATLLIIMRALYGGDLSDGWPGADIERALTESGRDKLRDRLADDTTELRQLADSPATGDWRVLTIPLLAGSIVQPVRIYVRRKKNRQAGEPAEEGGRFIVEVEMSRLGPLQLDGLFRPQRFDLMLRSHRGLSDAIRAEATRIFHESISASGIAGDIAFSTGARFAIAPMTAFRPHVTVSA
jgi:hypothetical protein